MSWITDNVFEFRPLSSESNGLLRYAEGKWIEDDGEFDIAFASGKTYCGAPYGIYLGMPSYNNLLWSYVYHGQWGDTIEEHPQGNAWHYMTSDGKKWSGYWEELIHPNVIVQDKATNKCYEIHRCANGGGPEFRINDPYIKAGLVRIKETEEIVKFPEIFKCCYCGDIDWRYSESISLKELYRQRQIKFLEAKLDKLRKEKY